jgi:hypothetical protein
MFGICLTLVSSAFNMPMLTKFGTLFLTAIVGFGIYMIVLFLALSDEHEQPDTSLTTYLGAFLSDWATGMSGPLSVPFTAMAVWSTQPIQKMLWGCLAILSLVFASYRVWRKERIQASARLDAIKSAAEERIARKDAEIANRDQKIQALTEKPKRSAAEQHHFETARKALQELGPTAEAALRHLRTHEALTFGTYNPVLPAGMRGDQLLGIRQRRADV